MRRRESNATRRVISNSPKEANFSEVLSLITAAQKRAYQAVNTALIDLYWQIGAYISRKIESAEWGDSVVHELALRIAQTHPNLRGFARPNLFRMRQFYDTYRDDEKVSPLVRQLPWTHNLIIFTQSKHPEEREFYLRLAMPGSPGKTLTMLALVSFQIASILTA